jgi:hypothetical protein
MAYVSKYKNDIFVSYAHEDNRLLPGMKDGWVTTLIEAVEIRLSQRLGRSEFYKLWIDDELSPSSEVTPTILQTLEDSAVIIIILSPSYVTSPWCQREQNRFFDLIKKRTPSDSSVFVIYRDRVDEDDMPLELKDYKKIKFWTLQGRRGATKIYGMPKPEEEEYVKLYNDLVFDLERALKKLKKTDEPPNNPATVYLAEVTDDLDPFRDEVKRYLDQQKINVLPDTLYPREGRLFQEALLKDLKGSKIFVQLLSQLHGKIAPGTDLTYPCLQYQGAFQQQLPILQWRSKTVDLEQVPDSAYKELLDKETVMAVGLEEFKKAVLKKANEKEPEPAKKPLNVFVFVNMNTADKAVAEAVCKNLDEYHAEYVLPLQSGSPEEIRKDLEQNLKDCDGVIIVYGEITVSWVREQLRQVRKLMALRDRPLKALAVYEGPPEPKDPIDLKLHRMRIIKSKTGLQEEDLTSFLESLKEERNHDN